MIHYHRYSNQLRSIHHKTNHPRCCMIRSSNSSSIRRIHNHSNNYHVDDYDWSWIVSYPSEQHNILKSTMTTRNMWNSSNTHRRRFVSTIPTTKWWSNNNDDNNNIQYYNPMEINGTGSSVPFPYFARYRMQSSTSSSSTTTSTTTLWKNHARPITSVTRWTFHNHINRHCSNFSTQPQRDHNNRSNISSHDSSISAAAPATTSDEDDDVDDVHDDDDAYDDEEVDNGDNDDAVISSNDEITMNNNTNIKSNDDVFNSIDFDSDEWELPPNPDIPPPKVRTPYPIVPPPSSNTRHSNNKSKHAANNDAASVLANERLVAQIMCIIQQRRNKSNNNNNNQQSHNKRNNHHHHHSNNSNLTADDIQVRVVPDVLTSKINKSVESTKKSITDNDDDDDDVDATSGTTTTAENDDIVVKDKKNSASGNKPKTIIVTLSEAIKMSIQRGKDLVEVSIDQDIPVVMISNVKGIAYQKAKTKKTVKVSNAASSQVKEVTMQAGIATNDLQRKVNDILKFLEKGHMCIVSIRINQRQTRADTNAPEVAIKRILPLLEDKIEMVVPPEINPLRTMASFRVRGKKK